MILYILLSGMPPFWGKTKSQIFDAVRAADLRFPSNPWNFISDSAKELIKGMLRKDTSRRLTPQQVLGRSLILWKISNQLYHTIVSIQLLICSLSWLIVDCVTDKNK